MLGGGGFTGGVYEIGALRALDLLSVNRTVNDFDIYVGTSAGSFVASLLAAGMTPEEMSRVVNKQVPTPFRDVDLGTLLRPNYADFASRALLMPLRLIGLAPQPRRPLARGLADGRRDRPRRGAAAGPLHGRRGSRSTSARSSTRATAPTTSACSSRSSTWPRTDLDTCERIVFGAPGWDDVPISKAVVGLDRAADGLQAGRHQAAASSIDGGIRSTTNVDIAVERGAKFIVVVNPLVPYVNDFQKRIPTIFGSRVRRVSDMGYPQVGYQAFKLLAHARLHEHVKHWSERYPGVDIILIEPDPNDELMFGTSIMNYSSRIEIARHGFESVTLRLAQDYRHYKRDLREARHRDLGPPRHEDPAPGRGAAREDDRLAADLRADDRRAAAPVRKLGLPLPARSRIEHAACRCSSTPAVERLALQVFFEQRSIREPAERRSRMNAR